MGDGLVNGFGGPSIGLHGLAMVFKGSQPLAKSFVSEGFNGWMATIGANGMTLIFGKKPTQEVMIQMISRNEMAIKSKIFFSWHLLLQPTFDMATDHQTVV